MKPLRLVVVLACFSIICAVFSGVVYGLDQDEARVSAAWSNETLFQGSSATVTILFISDSSEELTIYYFGLHFDWMDSDRFIGHDLSDDPVTVPSYGIHDFSPINIQIPEDAIVGPHSYFVGIDGWQGISTRFSWDSLTLTFVVQSSGQDVYSELVTKVVSDIAEAVDAEYQSSEAQSLLEQAESAYAQALSYANEENWDEAISALQNASTYLEQAGWEEKNYVEPKSQQDRLLIIVGVAVVVVVLIITLIVRRKRKKPAPVDRAIDA